MKRWRSKKGDLKCVMLPNLYILAATLQTYEKISKPVYRRAEFLFPTIKVPSDQWKKKSNKPDKQTARPILQTQDKTYWKSNTAQNKFSFRSPMTSFIVIIIIVNHFIHHKPSIFVTKFPSQVLRKSNQKWSTKEEKKWWSKWMEFHKLSKFLPHFPIMA